MSELEYIYSHNAVKIMALNPRRNCYVKDLLDAITAEGYQNYDFTSDGVGCRYWVSQIISLFQSNGLTPHKTECKEARDAVAVVWSDRGEAISGARITPGTFLGS